MEQPNVLRKANILEKHFIDSALWLNVFLNATGVYLIAPNDEAINKNKRKKRLQQLWSAFWLLLNTQSGAYFFARRGLQQVYVIMFESSSLFGGMLTKVLNDALMRASAFIFETITHYFLVLSIQSTFKRFFATLEPIYCQFGCPDVKRVRFFSTACLIFTLWMVTKRFVT